MAAPIPNPGGCCGGECCICEGEGATYAIRLESPCHNIDETKTGLTCDAESHIKAGFFGDCPGFFDVAINVDVDCDSETDKPRLTIGGGSITCVFSNSILADDWNCNPLFIEFSIEVACCCDGGSSEATVTVTDD